VLYERDIPGLENLTNLDRLPPTGARIVALPMKIGGGSGAPLRAIALLRQ
jgi:kynurenine formamidase